MIFEKITSEELYLDHPAGTVIKTYCLEDTSAAVYPCYYMKQEDYLLVSTSVVLLIKHVKSFEQNTEFKPINYMSGENANSKVLWKFSSLIPHKLRKKIREILARKFHIYLVEKLWYEKWDTIDKRINRLEAFQLVTPDKNRKTLKPDLTIRNVDTITEKVAFHLKDYVNKIEKKYPDYKHVVLVGGKDSRLITLIPKININNWIVFSAEPDYSLVKKWLERNNIEISELISHDNQNEETREETEQKILFSDLFSDPRHIRFLPTLKKIAKRFNQKCIFWSGTAAGTILAYHQDYPYEKPEKYFDVQYTREGLFQGIYHQVFQNFVECPLLSPYHTFQIWEDVINHLDPRVIKKGTDFRDEIGRKLSGRSINWDNENPHLAPYKYNDPIDSYSLYLKYIHDNTNSVNSEN